MDIAPASMMTMDSTQANTGRLMKNWAMDQRGCGGVAGRSG